MRVSSDVIYSILLRYDNQRNKKIERATLELSSGKSILKPSDNPIDFARSLRLNRLSEKLERFNRNISVASSYLDSAESFLNSAVNTLEDARVKFIQLLNIGALTKEDAKTLADYFKSIRNYVLQLGNEKEGDSYLFGGVKTQAPPFLPDGTYQGSTQETTVPVAPGVETNTNFNGEEYFAVNQASGKVLAVEVLDRVIEIVNSGDLNRLQTDKITVNLGGGNKEVSLLEAYDMALSKMSQYRSILGTKQKVLKDLETQNESINLKLKDLNSKLTDADYPKAISELEKAKTAYQALLAAISQVQGLSLLNFLK